MQDNGLLPAKVNWKWDRVIYAFFLSCVCYAFVCVCLFVPCGHLLGKG